MRDGQGTVTEPLNQIIFWVLTKFHHVRISNLEHQRKIASVLQSCFPFPPQKTDRKQTKIEFSEITKDVCSHILISDGHMWRRSVDQPRVWLCVCLDVWLLSEQLSGVCLWPGRPFHLQPTHGYVCRTDTAVTGWDGTESAGWQEDCFHSKSLIKNLADP